MYTLDIHRLLNIWLCVCVQLTQCPFVCIVCTLHARIFFVLLLSDKHAYTYLRNTHTHAYITITTTVTTKIPFTLWNSSPFLFYLRLYCCPFFKTYSFNPPRQHHCCLHQRRDHYATTTVPIYYTKLSSYLIYYFASSSSVTPPSITFTLQVLYYVSPFSYSTLKWLTHTKKK